MGRAYWGVEWVVKLLLGRSIVHAYQSQHFEITTLWCFSSFATLNGFPPWPTALLWGHKPSTYVGGWSFPHYPGRGREVWHVY